MAVLNLEDGHIVHSREQVKYKWRLPASITIPAKVPSPFGAAIGLRPGLVYFQLAPFNQLAIQAFNRAIRG